MQLQSNDIVIKFIDFNKLFIRKLLNKLILANLRKNPSSRSKEAQDIIKIFMLRLLCDPILLGI